MTQNGDAKRREGGRPLLGSHQKSWLWGRIAVLETLAAGKWPVIELHLADRLTPAERTAAMDLAARWRAPVRTEPAARLTQLCHAEGHQGYLAKMSLFPYADAADLLARRPAAPLYALLDGLHDPHNLGAIARSAEVFALDALFLGESSQAPVTTAAARASAGAVNRIPIALVADLAALTDALKAAGVAIVGASEKADLSVTQYDFARPTAVVLGNEAVGISEAVRARCDVLVRVPQYGRIGSLNAAAAAAIIFYEAMRQRRPERTPGQS